MKKRSLKFWDVVGINKWWQEPSLAGELQVQGVWVKEINEHPFRLVVQFDESKQVYQMQIEENLGETWWESRMNVEIQKARWTALVDWLKHVMRYTDGTVLRSCGYELEASELPYYSR